MIFLFPAAVAAPIPPVEPWANGSMSRFERVDSAPYGPAIGADASGAYYDDATDTLWIVQNGPADGFSWRQLWQVEHPTRPDQTITMHPLPRGDFEGVTGAGDSIYLLNEKGQNGSPSIHEFSLTGGTLTEGPTWTLPSSQVGRRGPEGITFVPDGHYDALLAAPAGPRLPGVFLVGSQVGGNVHVFAVPPTTATVSPLAVLKTSRKEVAGLEYRHDERALYVLHGAGHRTLEVVALEWTDDGALRPLGERRLGRAGNLEGLATLPVSGRETRKLFVTADTDERNPLRLYDPLSSRWRDPPGNFDALCKPEVGLRITTSKRVSDGLFYTLPMVALAGTVERASNGGSPWRVAASWGGPLAAIGIHQVTIRRAARPRPFTRTRSYRQAHPYGAIGPATTSFFSGHTVVAGASSFLTPSLYAVFDPEVDPATLAVAYGAATISTVAMGALRVRARKHHVTDVVVGGVVGAALGVLGPVVAGKLGLSREP